jgi:hypothetical protein
MIERLNAWLNRVPPTRFAWWAIVGGTLLAWLANLLFRLWLKVSIAPDMPLSDIPLPQGHLFVLGSLIIIAGALRAAWNHPLADRNYGAWLAQTPWRYPEPLPLGPIQLAWQDAAVMATAAAMACLPSTNLPAIFGIPVLYLLGYVAALCSIDWFAGLRWPAVLAVWLLGAALCLHWTAAFVLAALMLAVAYATIGMALSDFPFSEQRRRELGLLPFKLSPEIRFRWPVSPDHPSRWYFRIHQRDALVAAATVGWAIFAIAVYNRHEPGVVDGLSFVHKIIALVAVLTRLGVYVLDHWPPISLFGRWATRRWIIPKYDTVFVAPLVAALAAVVLPHFFVRMGVAPLVAWPLATAATLWLAAALPPDWETWHYTGHHNCTQVGVNSKEEVLG